MADRFEDARGVIQDLLGPVDAVTEIFTRAGAVRGNHVHNLTVQWTYIVSGRLMVAWAEAVPPVTGEGLVYGTEHVWVRHTAIYPGGQLVEERAGQPHAWKALEDTTVLVFTKGPRSGAAYESDTQRLRVPILT